MCGIELMSLLSDCNLQAACHLSTGLKCRPPGSIPNHRNPASSWGAGPSTVCSQRLVAECRLHLISKYVCVNRRCKLATIVVTENAYNLLIAQNISKRMEQVLIEFTIYICLLGESLLIRILLISQI